MPDSRSTHSSSHGKDWQISQLSVKIAELSRERSGSHSHPVARVSSGQEVTNSSSLADLLSKPSRKTVLARRTSENHSPRNSNHEDRLVGITNDAHSVVPLTPPDKHEEEEGTPSPSRLALPGSAAGPSRTPTAGSLQSEADQAYLSHSFSSKQAPSVVEEEDRITTAGS